jgi:hypothetical protein
MAEGISITQEYARQADEFVRLLAAFPSEALTRRSGSSPYSVTEIASQLADAELLASVRIRRIITQDRPNLYDYDPEAWAQRLVYQNQDLQDAALVFTTLRQANSALLERLAYEDWNRTGYHEAKGETSLFRLVEGYIARTAESLDQLREAAAEVTSHTNGHSGYFASASEAEPDTTVSGAKLSVLALMAGLTILTVGFFTLSSPI